MSVCDYCGAHTSLLKQVRLANGHVCKDCFHKANYGGYGFDDGSDKKLEWIALNIKKRNQELENFSASYTTACGLLADDQQLIFLFDGWTHSYMTLHSFRSFFEGKMIANFYRNNKYSNCYKNPVKRSAENCVYIQLEGYTYPSYIKITFACKEEHDECVNCLKHIATLATKWETRFSQELELKQREEELNAELIRIQQEIKKINELKKQLGSK